MNKKQGYAVHSVKGFTLLEMLVVIVIVGILSAIAAPSWQGFLDRQRMNSIRGELLSTLKTAQDEAQSLQKGRRVEFSLDPAAPMTVTVRDASAVNGGTITQLGREEAGSKFVMVAPSNFLIFDHDGRVNDDLTLPFAIKIVNEDLPPLPPGQSPKQSCVIVRTLLGGLQAANDEVCDNI